MAVKIFFEKASRQNAERTELRKLFKNLRKNDVVVVCKLDR